MPLSRKLSPEEEDRKTREREIYDAGCGAGCISFLLGPLVCLGIAFWVSPSYFSFPAKRTLDTRDIAAVLIVTIGPWILCIASIIAARASVSSRQRRTLIRQAVAERQAEEAHLTNLKRRQDEERKQQQLQGRIRHEEQQKWKRQQDRKFLLGKLTDAHNHIDCYDPASPDTASLASSRQDIANELLAVIEMLTPEERAAIILEDADVRHMVVSLRDELEAKGITLPQARQMFVGLPRPPGGL